MKLPFMQRKYLLRARSADLIPAGKAQSRIIEAMVARGLLEPNDYGSYSITEAGTAAVAALYPTT